MVIDWSEALDAPGDIPYSSSIDASKTLGKLCPHCKKSYLIQIDTENKGSPLPASFSSLSSQSPKFKPKSKTAEETLSASGNGLKISVPNIESSVDSHNSQSVTSPGHIDISQFNYYPTSSISEPSINQTDGIVPPNITRSHHLLGIDHTHYKARESPIPIQSPVPVQSPYPWGSVPHKTIVADTSTSENNTDVMLEGVMEEEEQEAEHRDGDMLSSGSIESKTGSTKLNCLKEEGIESVSNESERVFGGSLVPSSLLSQRPYNPFDDESVKNPFDKLTSQKVATASNPFDQIQPINPFDHVDLSSGGHKVSHNSDSSNNPFDEPNNVRRTTRITNSEDVGSKSNGMSACHQLQSKSLGKLDAIVVAAKSPNSSPVLSRGSPTSNVPTRHRERREAEPLAVPTTKLRAPSTPADSPTVSKSVPSEKGLKSYLSSFMSKGRREGDNEEASAKDRRGHNRSHSQDFKVPPLPSHLKERRLEISPKPLASSSPTQQRRKRSSRTSESSGSMHSNRDTMDSSRGGAISSGSSGSGSKKRKSYRSYKHNKLPNSSETDEGKSSESAQVSLYMDSNPAYLHSNFILYLDLNKFDSEQKEKFELCLRVSCIIHILD